MKGGIDAKPKPDRPDDDIHEVELSPQQPDETDARCDPQKDRAQDQQNATGSSHGDDDRREQAA